MVSDWKTLYELQDWTLASIRTIDHGLYLTGGTALSRAYCGHRYSEDLDFFANDAPEFELWRDRCLAGLERASRDAGWRLEILLREARFGRAVLHGPCPLKLEFVNDVPFRVGEPFMHPALGRLDTRENILANKVSSIVDRHAPKDLADIYWLCCREGLSLVHAMKQATGKAAGIFPPFVARALHEVLSHGIPNVAWILRPEEGEFRQGIESLIAQLLKDADEGPR
jgi:hypothetical protein